MSMLPAQSNGVCPRHEEVSADLCAEHGCPYAKRWIASSRMQAALELIAEMGDKTLIHPPNMDRAVCAAYSLGAHRAFAEAASYAKEAMQTSLGTIFNRRAPEPSGDR